MTEWKPIETAPEEGCFLISDGHMVVYAAREKGDYWDIAGYKWPAPQPKAKLGITHWMPLPEPPK